MRAIVVHEGGGPDVLELEEVPDPAASNGHVLVRLGAAYKTAWAALADAELEAGETLLVQAGSSGTGQAAIDIGRHLGADVYATASFSKHDRLRELGAEPLAYDDERIAELEADV